MRRFRAKTGEVTGTLSVVLSIEKQCFEEVWGHSGFCHSLAVKGVQGWVAEINLDPKPGSIAVEPVGYGIFNATTGEIFVIAVEPKYHRMGVGTVIICQMLTEKAQNATLWCDVNDANYPAHQFLKANKFLAISCGQKRHGESHIDTIRFRHTPRRRGQLPKDRIGML